MAVWTCTCRCICLLDYLRVCTCLRVITLAWCVDISWCWCRLFVNHPYALCVHALAAYRSYTLSHSFSHTHSHTSLLTRPLAHVHTLTNALVCLLSFLLDEPPGVAWNESFYGRTTSTYPMNSRTNRREGDPIADCFGFTAFEGVLDVDCVELLIQWCVVSSPWLKSKSSPSCSFVLLFYPLHCVDGSRLFVVADGCNWGEKARRAARIARDTCLAYVLL
jgi:hypothetical protein